MLRQTITLDSQSDATAILQKLRADAERAGFPPEPIIAAVEQPLQAMISTGRNVATSSGQFRASKSIRLENALITIVARFGVPSSLLSRLGKLIGFGG